MVKRRATYGPSQVLNTLDFGRVAAAAEEVGYGSVQSNRGDTLASLLTTYKPYFVLPGLTEGAPNTYNGAAPQTVQVNLSDTVLPNTDAGVYVCKGKQVITFRNNWDSPCTVSFYLHKAVAFGSLSPIDIFNAEITSKYRGAAITSATAIMDGLSLCKTEINKYWKQIGRVQVIHLEPNRQCTYSYSTPGGWFDHEEYIAMSSPTYYPKLSTSLTVAVRGVIGHDATQTANVGLAPAQVDYMERTYLTWKVRQTQPLATRWAVTEDNNVVNYRVAIPEMEHQDADGDLDD